MKKLHILTILFLATNSLFAQMQTMVDTKKTYEGISVVEIEAGMLEVNYQGRENLQEINLEAFLESDSDQGQDIVFVTVGNTLKIQYRTPNRTNNRGYKTKGHLHLEGPADMQLKVHTTSGKVNLENLSSNETHVDFVSGNIQLRNIEGDVHLNGTSGKIDAQNIGGSLFAKMTSGSAKIDGVGQNLEFEATSGKLEAKNVEGYAGAQITSGNMNLDKIGELRELTVTSGNINAKNSKLGPRTGLYGSSGNIRVQTDSDLNEFNFNFTTGSGNVKVGKVSSGKILDIDNESLFTIKGKMGSGSITIEN
jgi:lia operon protein LiaG